MGVPPIVRLQLQQRRYVIHGCCFYKTRTRQLLWRMTEKYKERRNGAASHYVHNITACNNGTSTKIRIHATAVCATVLYPSMIPCHLLIVTCSIDDLTTCSCFVISIWYSLSLIQ
jgi:hypothetical protein